MLRILHTADWQLGMTRHFLSGEAQARYTADRLEAVRAVLRLAHDEACEAVVVAGDVFETNQVDRRTVAQALDALGASKVPVYLLPGNHDPLDAAAVFRSRAFVAGKSAHVHVLDTSEPRRLPSGAEIVGAPWSSKRPLSDLVADVARGLEPTDTPRVLVGHGAVDSVVAIGRENPAVISHAAASQAIAERRFHYLALGDRHSATRVGTGDRIWYAGSQETTDFDETRPGEALIVDVGPESCTVTPHRVGKWTFHREEFELLSDDDLAGVEKRLAAFPDKLRTVAKLGFRGTLTLRQRARLDAILDGARDLLAAVVEWERVSEIAIRPDADDLAGLDLDGFARRAAESLRTRAAAGGADAEDARGALSLLFRLSRRDA
ncbi:MAG: exonuclease SbcCD subunit D [Planctomycetes bacterium]|nr:exonuclease SbcCD subunit D [Planctomycetota bacterium]